MIDFWFNDFNISATSILGALILLFITALIVIGTIGKRRCNAFDVIFRVFASLVMVASAAMYVCSILAISTGFIRIELYVFEPMGERVSGVFVFNEIYKKLPVPELFVFGGTIVGNNGSFMLLACSLAALIADCVVANKKDEKADEKKQQKKITKEKKTKAAAAEKSLSPEERKRRAELEKIRRIGESAVQKTSAVAEKQAAHEKAEPDAPARDEPEFDWRTADNEQEQKPTEFVGIKENPADGFDDNFDDSFDGDRSEPDVSLDFDDGGVSFNASEEDTAFSVEPESDIIEERDFDETPDREQQERYAEPERDEELAKASGATERLEFAEEREKEGDGSELELEQKDNGAEDPEPEFGDEQAERMENIEPDRGIYIPEIRTVTRNGATARTTRGTRTTDGKPTAAAKPAAKQPTKPRATAAASKKPTAAKSATAKPKTATKTATKPQDNKIPAEKKLPVTRRYVILDRRSAVNMFGEYLKDRDKQSKDKLEKSINTIIIE